MKTNYTFGAGIESWKQGTAQTVTFVVTEECNLRCKYCYISHKASDKRMNFETAKKFIDLILSDQINHAAAVILEFIGGEPFLEIELIDKISDYFKLRAFELQHPWYWNYRFSFSTNGINYNSKEVQNYIEKNRGKISIGITIDGNREKHDLQRVFPDGSGSYDAVVSNIPLYLKQFKSSTKVTFASDDLKYLKDSIVNLWNIGITEVAANVVFENVWKRNDEILFENQLKELADYVIENQLFTKYKCTLFDDMIGGYLGQEQLDRTSCGAGKMMAVDAAGNIFPCIRYKGYSLDNKEEWIVGNVDNGIDMDRVRPFIVAATKYQSDEECNRCSIGSGCGQCQGFSYDMADTDTNYQRAKFICKMHKARVRANEYYFTRLYQTYGIRRKRMLERKQIYFLLSDNYITFCSYENKKTKCKRKMTDEVIEDGLKYCYDTYSQPVFVHPKDKVFALNYQLLNQIESVHIVAANLYEKDKYFPGVVMYVFDEETTKIETEELDNCILNIKAQDIGKLAELTEDLLKKAVRVNINVICLDKGLDENMYREQLKKVKSILQKYQGHEVNVISDLGALHSFDNCKAGDRSFTLTEEGNLVNCVGLYEEGLELPIGTAKTGIVEQRNSQLYSTEYHPLCQKCDAYQCRNCIWLNKKMTKEVNVSPAIQCRKSRIEQKVFLEGNVKKDCNIEYFDPIEKVQNEDTQSLLFYKIEKRREEK